jgi:hypothetical protein
MRPTAKNTPQARFGKGRYSANLNKVHLRSRSSQANIQSSDSTYVSRVSISMIADRWRCFRFATWISFSLHLES